jgi:hypothetical protein
LKRKREEIKITDSEKALRGSGAKDDKGKSKTKRQKADLCATKNGGKRLQMTVSPKARAGKMELPTKKIRLMPVLTHNHFLRYLNHPFLR